jgi:D-glycerate 3-kinase
MIIGVQGVQGSGKTTTVQNSCSKNKNFQYISIDDFYYPDKFISTLYRKTNYQLWKFRGNPGTHDIQLLLHVLKEFKNKQTVNIPIYDKKVNNGRGDRVGWKPLIPSTHLFLEGWCVGFKPVYDSKDLIDISLRAYESINKILDGIFILQPPYLNIVYKWREDAEKKNRNSGGGMSQSKIKEFVDIYMPIYQRYLPQLYNDHLHIPKYIAYLDENRKIIRTGFITPK